MLFSSLPKIQCLAPICSFQRSRSNRQTPQKTRHLLPDRQPPNCRRKLFALGLANLAPPRRSPKYREKFLSSDWPIAEFVCNIHSWSQPPAWDRPAAWPGIGLGIQNSNQTESPNFEHIGGGKCVLGFPHRNRIARSRSNDQVIGTRADVRQNKFSFSDPKA